MELLVCYNAERLRCHLSVFCTRQPVWTLLITQGRLCAMSRYNSSRCGMTEQWRNLPNAYILTINDPYSLQMKFHSLPLKRSREIIINKKQIF
jgi:hypothetical protein